MKEFLLQFRGLMREIVSPEPILFPSNPKPEKFTPHTIPLSEGKPKRKITVSPSESEYILMIWKNDILLDTIAKQGRVIIETLPRLVKTENGVGVKTITTMCFVGNDGEVDFKGDYDTAEALIADINKYIEIDDRIRYDKVKSKEERTEQDLQQEYDYDEEHFDLERYF